MNPTKIRLLGQFRGGPIVELWRGQHRNHVLTQNAMTAMTAEMSKEWFVWMERPARDNDTIGRLADCDCDLPAWRMR